MLIGRKESTAQTLLFSACVLMIGEHHEEMTHIQIMPSKMEVASQHWTDWTDWTDC